MVFKHFRRSNSMADSIPRKLYKPATWQEHPRNNISFPSTNSSFTLNQPGIALGIAAFQLGRLLYWALPGTQSTIHTLCLDYCKSDKTCPIFAHGNRSTGLMIWQTQQPVHYSAFTLTVTSIFIFFTSYLFAQYTQIFLF